MPFPTKVLPLDGKEETAWKPAGKSRLKRLLERSLLRTSSAAEKLAAAAAAAAKERDDIDSEPNSVCLDSMVLSFMESGNEKPTRCGFGRCNCFNCDGRTSDEDIDPPPTGDAAELLKGLVPCVNVSERNLLADATRIADKAKGRCDFRRAVAEELRSAGYDAAVCKSKWEKGAAFPAGEYEYIDVVAVADGGEEPPSPPAPPRRRMIVDVDFRSEFEIARSTKAYRAVLQALPPAFVGSGERLQQIVAVVSEAARVSLRKKGLHFPPWRNPDYMRSKWLAPYERESPPPAAAESHCGEGEADGGGSPEVSAPWQPPPVRRKAAAGRVVTGLASVIKRRPSVL